MSLFRGKTTKAAGAGADLGLAIGESDIEYFNCPGCSRPLVRGVMRCPGCGAAMILGIRFKRALVLMVPGTLVGLALGGLITTSVIGSLFREPKPVAAVVPVVSPPVASAAVSSSLPVRVPVHATPPAAVSALSGTAVVNGRIAVDTVTLSRALADRNASSVEIARAFRSLAADAALGIDVAARLASWPEAATVKAELESFYVAMADSARSALRAPYSDRAGYRAAAAAMMPVLAKLGAVDAVSRTLATTIDLELPPVALAP